MGVTVVSSSSESGDHYLDVWEGHLSDDEIRAKINDEYGDVDSILYMITSDGADYAQMKKVAEAFRRLDLGGR